MARTSFADAIERALEQEMAKDENIVIFGEDVELLRVNLCTRFGNERVRNTPISESAFLGASVTAAMSGLKPVVEIMLVDFIGVCVDGILNHAAKNKFFSGGKWNVPLVVRTSCGGGYGDAGQHEQSLWGWLGHIPGVNIAVPSNPLDAAGLMVSAIACEDPVIYFEHKLLSDYFLDYMGIGGRENMEFDVPEAGAFGDLPEEIDSIPLGKAKIKRKGSDITFVSLGVSVHRCHQAANLLSKDGIDAEVIDLRTVVPLDVDTIVHSVKKTGNLIVVDEDYEFAGLSGEICAQIMEKDVKFAYRRVCTENTIPFNRKLEDETLPNVKRIIKACKHLLS